MKYPRILSALRTAKWAIAPGALSGIVDTLGAHLRGDLSLADAAHRHRAALPDLMPAADDAPAAPSLYATPVPGVAVVPVHGVIGKHLSALETLCGGVDVDAIAAALDAAAADPAVQTIVLDIDSPGGVVTGVPELAERIRALPALGKSTVAFTDTMAASAAYWLAAATQRIVSTPTADLGSIGVYVALLDDSAWYAKEGYRLELIKAGRHKAAGISGHPLADEDRAMIQTEVDEIYAMFTADVRAGRPGITDDTMQGQTFMGQRAAAAQLTDAIVSGFDELLATLATTRAG